MDNDLPIVPPSNSSFASERSEVIQPKKSFVWLAVVVILALLLGGGVWAYYSFFNHPTPQEVIKKMFNNLTEVKSVQYAGNVVLESKNMSVIPFLKESAQDVSLDTSSQEVKVTVNLSGVGDFFDPSNPVSEASYQFQAAVPPQNFSLGLSTKSIGSVNYFSFSNLPKLGFFDLSFLQNQWIKFDKESFVKAVGSFSGALGKNLEDYDKKNQKAKEANEKIKNLIKENNILAVASVLPDEKIGEEKTFHYKVKINQDGFVKLTSAIEQMVQGREVLPAEQEKINKAFDSIKDQEGDLWIAKADYLPRRLSFEGYSDVEQKSKIKVDLQFNNFNQHLKIEAPAQSFPLDEMLKSLGSGLGALQSKTAGTSTIFSSPKSGIGLDSDGDGLVDTQEISVWHTDPLKADTDGDGFSDFVEIKNGFDPNGPGKLQ